MGSLRGRRAEAVFVMVVRSEGVVKRRWIWRSELRENEEKKKKKRERRQRRKRGRKREPEKK